MIASNSSIEAAKLLLLRREARRHFAQWCRLCGFEPARHHLLLIEKLEAVVRGDIQRLAVFMPPGSAKSTYSSKLFPPWYLAQLPQSNILACSHSADLAAEFGRDSRNYIDQYANVLGYALCKDSQAADRWTIEPGGLFFCAGVGGKIAGRRADLGLIDDPIGSKEDADSDVIRNKAWHWYRNDFVTRLKPNARRVLIQTRWHEDDLAGRILQKESHLWEVISLPMEALEHDVLGRRPGELLWPDYFTQDMLLEAKEDREKFSALYQQNPSPEDGDYFRKAWIEDNSYGEGELPSRDNLVTYVASDHAVSMREAGDSSCIIPCGVDPDGVIWIMPEVQWAKFDTLDAVNLMTSMMRKLHPSTWWAEADKIGKSIGPFLRKKMREDGVFCYIEEMHPAKDKKTRAQSIRARMQAGMVRFPRFAPWYPMAVNQMLKFPNATHDDFIDPLAYIGLGLDKMATGSRGVAPQDETLHLRRGPRMTMKWLKRECEHQQHLKRMSLCDN